MNMILERQLSEIIDYLVLEVLGKFDFNHFKRLAEREHEFPQIDTWRGKVKRKNGIIGYALDHLPTMGIGSSRMTFALSGGKVLKIAINEKGVAQNEAEIDIGTSSRNVPLITKVFDFDQTGKGLWLTAEIVKEFKEGKQELNNVLGLPSHVNESAIFSAIEDLSVHKMGSLEKSIIRLQNEINNNSPYKAYKIGLVRDYEEILKRPKVMAFINDVLTLIKDPKYDLVYGDMHIKHFGVTVDGQVRLLDFGHTDDVITNHY